MNQHMRTTRHRLTTAIAVALALTAGAVATAAPAAFAAPAAAGQEAEQAVAPFPLRATVAGVGPTGFLSGQSGPQITWRWTRFADGAETVLPAGSYRAAHQTDIVAQNADGVFTLRDMGRGGEPLVIDTNPLGAGYTIAGYAGTRLVMKKARATGGTELHIVGTSQGALTDDTVTGLPDDAVITSVAVDSPDTAVVRYATTVDGVAHQRAAVADVAAHAVVEQYELPEAGVGSLSLSATHIAWVEKPASTAPATVVVTRRGTGETVRHDLGVTTTVAIELIGDWVTYRSTGNPSPYDQPNALYALYARSLTTGETVKLLEHAQGSVDGPDGTQVARGGTLEHGEGLYRIAPGADGARPVVTLVASTGESTSLQLVKQDVPEAIDLDTTPAPRLSWTLNRVGATVKVELVHTATGKRTTVPAHFNGRTVYAAEWNGMLGDALTAHNGDYTWKMTATALSGIGPAVTASGAFKVTRKPTSHDFDDNGTADLLIRNGAGELFIHDGYTGRYGPTWQEKDPVRIGTGWNTYDQLVAPGNVAGSSYADIVARDKTGVLWLHQGAGRTLAPRVRVGGGWQVYDRITGGSDVDGDGRPDLLATDKTGVLWLYKGTGGTTNPFSARVKIGGGWGVYNTLVAPGNLGGAAAGDLVARDKAGALWLYLAKGDGTFAARTLINSNWGPFTPVAVGDADRDGHPDLVGQGSGGGVYLAKGTGDWRKPFGALDGVAFLGAASASPNILF
ncbi:FG-GAP repeat domain-containing protein [Streptomyces sp. NPDC056549]|uniref:FG-GAP repeat domain-containing protein n=1 Tax=Streptomyces sp. NPDC056549 TaxID=3345864 RepID=UPI003675828F